MKSIKKKILFSFAIILLILVGIATYSFYTIKYIASDLEDVTATDIKFLESANIMSFSVANRAKIARDYVLFNRNESKQQFIDETEKAINTEEILLNAIEEGRISEEVKEAVMDADEKTSTWRKLVLEEIIPLYDSGDVQGAIKLMEEKCLPYSQEAIDAWVKVVEIQTNHVNEQTESVESFALHSEELIVVSAIIAVILAIVIAIFNANKISKPITKVVNRLETIADGDLSGENLETTSKDEIGRLIDASNKMASNLKILVEKVSETSSQVAASSQQFNASAEQSSSSAELITSSIQEIAIGAETSSKNANDTVNAMGTMFEEVKRIADSSIEVSNISRNTTLQANEGFDLVSKAVSQMQSIHTSVGNTSGLVLNLSDSSNQIGEIVAVITGIAEQTNLLALNAAIEAARAGEHGRGFAVVADEVRKLAEQSKISAEQIATLINKIQQDTTIAVESMSSGLKEVERGTTVINETGQNFNKIVESINLVSNKIDEVSASVGHMEKTAKHVNSTIHSLASIAEDTSSNSQNVAAASEQQLATMQEIAASANSMSQLAEELQELLNKFRL